MVNVGLLKSFIFAGNPMAVYQTSKQIIKFTISGLVAVVFDFGVYYGLSNMFNEAVMSSSNVLLSLNWNDIFKAFGFLSGTLVTYNLNKFWTWRTPDRNHKRLFNFLILYSISFVLNVLVNKWGLNLLHDNELVLMFRDANDKMYEFLAFKTDKLFAFVLATTASSILNFIGQKVWIFNRSETMDTTDGAD
jgi:putative flippase GtrA